MRFRLLALALLASNASTALARPAPEHEGGDALDALKDAVGEARIRSERDPELFRPSEVSNLAREVEMSRSLADRLPESNRRIFLDAAAADARRISEGARETDRSSARRGILEGWTSLFSLNRQGEAANDGGVEVAVSVFTLNGLSRVGGYAVSAHRVGNPAEIQTFSGVTKIAAPTASRSLIPGNYRFIVRMGGHEVRANRPVDAGRPTQEIELPLR